MRIVVQSSNPIDWSGILFVIVALLLVGASLPGCSAQPPTTQAEASFDNTDDVFRRAFEQRARNLWVEGHGEVKRILSDDNDGSRHQRFILQLNSGQTLLIAHNIDVAPRVEGLQSGDKIHFRGIYEWNPQGGVVHWSHHDPKGKQSGGWVKHRGKTYQ